MTVHRRSTCGAHVKSRPGGRCEQRAGWGTDHVGVGRCKLHGGATPIKSDGRCSEIYKQLPRLGERIAQFLEDPEPLNLMRDLATLRALLTDYIERYEEFTDALIAWHETFREEEGSPKPARVLDIASARKMVVDIARVVAIIEKQQERGAITMETFNRVVSQMGVTVANHVKDEATLRKIEAEWAEIRVA